MKNSGVTSCKEREAPAPFGRGGRRRKMLHLHQCGRISRKVIGEGAEG